MHVLLGVSMALLGAASGLAAAEVRGRTAADTSRIVSIGGAVTEILFALGLGDRVVAVDQTSRYPAAARQRPDVGYSRALSPEGVLSIGPSLILAAEGAGPRSTLDVLEHASVPVVLIPEAHDKAGVLAKIAAVAKAVGEEERGRALAAEVAADFAAVEEMVAALPGRPRAVFVLSASGGAAVVGGADTSADAIFRLAGVTNAMAAIKGFKPALDEAAMVAEPEAVVVMQGGGQVLDADTVFSLPAFAGTPAARERRLVAMPGSYLLGFGPRAPRAARDLAAALHPGARLPELPPRLWSVEKEQ
ncbi:ABC transporter substrate-binding protein [Xanthobacter autotrophicus]|uniref:heme/hemin ABC transporter substrate-binding protein n=1 Tax=Xanthobacter TaxID=279 RepID=UPI0024AB9F8C|nr:ABC transporter substrate-binding protein [Xanthobacter autotrophicus]MDI4664565.1 ABC transporter substrate-binding protein [Xanthobacter autotrophicus]